MKLFLAVFLISTTSLFACPNLEGTYSQCADDSLKNKKEVIGGRVHNLGITQDKIEDRDSYTFEYKDNSDEISRPYGSAIVGKTNVIEKFDRWTRVDIKQEITAKCDKNSLLINSKIYHSGKLFSNTNEVLTKNDKNMIHKISGMTDGKQISVVMDCQI